MYEFNEKLSTEFIELIKKGIDVCNDLNIPISKNILFKLCTGSTRLGYTFKKDKYDIVFINKNIESSDEIINTTIHELLHTIPNDGFKPHSGNWKKYADIVSTNTLYKITVTDNSNDLDYKKSIKRNFVFVLYVAKVVMLKLQKFIMEKLIIIVLNI